MTEQTNTAKPQGIVAEILDTAKVIVEALLIAFVVRMFLFQPFNIPSASMYPTLDIGDYLFVSKLSYGYGKYSFNFQINMPAALGGGELVNCCNFVNFPGRKIFPDSLPERGQVAVFKYTRDTSIDYIKRVIGLPGDRVQMRGGQLYINGQQVKRERVADYVDPDRESVNPGLMPTGTTIPQYRETLPNGVSYNILVQGAGHADGDDTDEFVVPANHYFMMGDNRDNSADSRFGLGFVPVENFVGRADIIFFSFKPSASLFRPWEWPLAIRYLRFFKWLH